MRSLRRLLPYFRPYRGTLIAGLACVVLSGALGSVNPWLLRVGIDSMRVGGSMATAWRVGGAMLGVSLLGGVFRFGMRQLLNALSRKIEFDLRNDLFQHLLTLDAPYFATTRTGELMARLTNDLGAVRMAAGPAIMYFVNTTVGGLFALGFMLSIEPRLAALALLPMLPLPFVMVRLGRTVHERFESVQEHFGAMTTRVQENLSGTRIVRAYRQERSEEDRFAAMSDTYVSRNMQLATLQAVMSPTFALLAGLGSVVVLGAGGALVVRGSISVGAFVAFSSLMALAGAAIYRALGVWDEFQFMSVLLNRLNDIFEQEPEQGHDRSQLMPVPTLEGHLALKNVGFRYGGKESPDILKAITLEVPHGRGPEMAHHLASSHDRFTASWPSEPAAAPARRSRKSA